MRRRPILIVDDDTDIRELLGVLLEHRGYPVSCAASGPEALALLRTASDLPGLIILDLRMPEMDGYAFRAAQWQIPRAADIPVIVTSAIVDPGIEALRPAAMIMKPLELDDLLPVVQRHYREHGGSQ